MLEGIDNKDFCIIALIAILVSTLIYLLLTPLKPKITRLPDTLPPPETQALLRRALENNKNVTLFGAGWCHFTVKQLNEIGHTEFEYVDCAKEGERCQSEEITAFPTWKIKGHKYTGFFPAEELILMLKN